MNSESLDLSSFDTKSSDQAHTIVKDNQLREQVTRESHQECSNDCCMVIWKPVRSYERSSR